MRCRMHRHAVGPCSPRLVPHGAHVLYSHRLPSHHGVLIVLLICTAPQEILAEMGGKPDFIIGNYRCGANCMWGSSNDNCFEGGRGRGCMAAAAVRHKRAPPQLCTIGDASQTTRHPHLFVSHATAFHPPLPTAPTPTATATWWPR